MKNCIIQPISASCSLQCCPHLLSVKFENLVHSFFRNENSTLVINARHFGVLHWQQWQPLHLPLESIKYTSDDDVDVISDMDKMKYDDVMITRVTPLYPRKRLEILQKIKNIKNEIDDEISLIVDSIIFEEDDDDDDDDDDDAVITGQTALHP